MADEESFSIRIVDDDGDGVEGVSVYLDYSSLMGATDTETTDEDGWAEFQLMRAFGEGLPLTINQVIANGTVVMDDSFTPDDGDTFSFTLSD